MAKRAVLVGCNYINDPDNRLNGCVNDVLLAKDVLINRFKFPAENISLLIDEGNDGKLKQPTGKNMIIALRSAMKASKPGDTLYFHFSGHGSYLPDQSGEESDKQDELIVASDFMFLTDDFLRTQIASLPDGVRFIMVSDSCNSATMLDQADSDIRLTGDKGLGTAAGVIRAAKGAHAKVRQISPQAFKKAVEAHYKSPGDFLASGASALSDKPGATPAAAAATTWDAAIRATAAAQKPAAAAGGGKASRVVVKDKFIVLLSGCQDNQESADASGLEPGKSFGAFTYTLYQTIKNKPGTISYWDAVQGSRNLLAQLGYPQNPTLSCIDSVANQPFLVDVV